MNRSKDQEEWMLMQQRQKKSRAQSLPHSALGIQIGQRGPRIINTNTGPKKAANYINKIPKVIQLQNQNQPCIKVDCSETLFETASSEIKRSTEKDGNDCKQNLPSSYRDENLLSLEKNHEIRSSQMSTLQLPDMGRNIGNNNPTIKIFRCFKITYDSSYSGTAIYQFHVSQISINFYDKT